MRSATHYHIQWSANSPLDWKPFPTKEEATILAQRIKKPNERYTIEGHDDDCERCKEFKLKAFFAVNAFCEKGCQEKTSP